MTECPGCGGPLAGDEETCPACGASIEGGGTAPAPAPAPAESGAEVVPSVEPQAENGSGKLCPECGALNPAEARFCVGCRHGFAGRAPFLGAGWLVIPALIAVVLIVAAVAAFSFGFVAPGPKAGTPVNNSSAISGANGTAHDVVNQTRNVSRQDATEVIAARNGTATMNVTPTRTVDPNSTPWNGADGAGIYHTEGGTHYVGISGEIMQKRREASATPTPVSVGFGDGSGHATAPLSWVGTGNWSPGFVDLPAGDAQVVLLSQGATAFILADPSGNHVGFGAFLPPGGTYTVPIQQAGRYVIAFGTANATDSWSATVLLPGSGGGQAAAPPVATPATQILSFAGTGGGSPGSFNLSPGTVHVALTADQMTMAYIKDPWGVTLSTTVAGPYAGGSTVAITQAGTYRLEVWGTGTWSATVTWTAPTATTAATIATPPPTLIAMNTTPPITPTPTTVATTVASGLPSFSGTGPTTTAPFSLNAVPARFRYTHAGTGHFSLNLSSTEGQFISQLENFTGPLAGEQVVTIEKAGDYVLRVEADPGADWTVAVS
ncbi:MAG: zinc ribbon domain-containing protein [Methanospirillum sp.]